MKKTVKVIAFLCERDRVSEREREREIVSSQRLLKQCRMNL